MGCSYSKETNKVEEEHELEETGIPERVIQIEEQQQQSKLNPNSNHLETSPKKGSTKSKSTSPSSKQQSKIIRKAAEKEIAKERKRRSRMDNGHGRDGWCVFSM